MPKDGRDSDLRRVLYGIVREVTGAKTNKNQEPRNQRRVKHEDEDIIEKKQKDIIINRIISKNNNIKKKKDSKIWGIVSRKGDEKDKRGGIIKMRQDQLFGWQIINGGLRNLREKKKKWKIEN